MANSSYLSFTNIRKCSSFQIERTKQNKLSYKKQNLRIFCLIPPPKKKYIYGSNVKICKPYKNRDLYIS